MASLVDDLVIIAVIVAAAVVAVSVGLPWFIVIPVSVVVALISIAMIKGALAQLRPPVKGIGSVKGLSGIVIDASSDYLLININGELWRGRCVSSCDDLRPGSRVIVVGIDGYEVLVRLACNYAEKHLCD